MYSDAYQACESKVDAKLFQFNSFSLCAKRFLETVSALLFGAKAALASLFRVL